MFTTEPGIVPQPRPAGRREETMHTWKRICCPVDFSEESRAAVEAAADLARRLDADLVLLHVDDQPAAVVGLLSAFREEAVAAGAPRVQVEHARGEPKTAIATWVDGRGFDLVVMGTHGRTGRAHALFGSVAESTVRTARTPVMVVHAEGHVARMRRVG